MGRQQTLAADREQFCVCLWETWTSSGSETCGVLRSTACYHVNDMFHYNEGILHTCTLSLTSTLARPSPGCGRTVFLIMPAR